MGRAGPKALNAALQKVPSYPIFHQTIAVDAP